MLLGVFDIGGTSIKYGVAEETGKVVFSSSIPTEAYAGGRHVLQKVISASNEMKEKWDLAGITISTAGQIGSNGAVIYASDNIPGYTGLNIKKEVENAVQLPVKVENDANCAAIGEHWKGAARNAEDFICITLGTGIGGAIFLNGCLYTGQGYSAGEVGHINLYPHGKDCTCGLKGCYEQYASSKALEELVADNFEEPMNLTEFFEMVHANDEKSLRIYDRWLDDLTTGLQTMIHLLNPQLVVIGGGISEQGETFLRAIENKLYPKIMQNHVKNLEIKLAEHGNQANLLGAVRNFLQK